MIAKDGVVGVREHPWRARISKRWPNPSAVRYQGVLYVSVDGRWEDFCAD